MKKNSAKKSPTKPKGKEKSKKTINSTPEKIDPNVPIPEPKPASVVPPSAEKIKVNKEKEEKDRKLEEIFANADKITKYDFNLHKHLKENIKFRDKQCKDSLTKESLYCLECKLSTCPNCSLFKIHNGHLLVKKYPYYVCNDELINENFDDIDKILNINPDFLNSLKVKEELKKYVNYNLDILQNKLNEIRISKREEIEKIFEKTEGCVEVLKNNIKRLKGEIKLFFEKQKKFLCIDMNENQNINQVNPQVNKVMKNLQEESKSNTGLITTNKDSVNATFLITYDLLKHTKNINDQIKSFINDIRVNREKFLNDFTKKKKFGL